MYDQQIQGAKQRFSKAENVVRRLRKAVVDAESHDHIAGVELVRLKLELAKAEELAFEVSRELDGLRQLQREVENQVTSLRSPAAVCTAVHESELTKLNVWNFDAVQLASRGGLEGTKVWVSPKYGRGQERRETGRLELLVIYVEDDPNSSVAVKRVRDMLGLNALPRPQPTS